MSIQESIVSGENIILHNGIVLPEETDFRPCMQYILSENQSILLKSKYKGHEDLCTLFLTAFRIVCSKYRYSNETLSCKSIIFTRDSSKTRYNLINETSFDFPTIKTNETTLQTVFNESKEVFFNNHLTGEQLTEFNCSKAVFHALNTESNQTELEYTIRLIDEYISIEFKAPADSPYAKAVSNSSNHFIQILNAFIQSPDAIIATVQITDKSEQDKLLEWGFGEYDPSLNQLDCLHHLFERTLASFPDLPAVYCNGRSFSYKEIDHKANQLARYLQHKGIGRGDYCAILLARSQEMYIAMLGILKTGAAYIPVDSSIPRERLHFILSDSGCKGLISHTTFEAKYKNYELPITNYVPQAGTNHECIEIILDEEAFTISKFDASPPTSQPAWTNDTAYVIYTSGTTGTPKGVKISHAAISNLVRAEARLFKVTNNDKVFQGFSISFDASLEEIWLAFSSGAQLFIGTEEIVQSGGQIADFINQHQITVFSTVPSLLSTITDELATVKTLILGGEACSTELARKWSAGTRRMVNTYGPTEATVVATYSVCKPDKAVTIGRPLVNYSAYILDSNQQIVPVGVEGELCIGGLSLAEGYINIYYTGISNKSQLSKTSLSFRRPGTIQ